MLVRTKSEAAAGVFALIAASLFAGWTPGFERAALEGAARFTDHGGYAKAVLDGSPVSPPPAPRVPAIEIGDGALAVLAAVAIAMLNLLPRRSPKLKGPVGALLHAMRDSHSGHVGDYVAWLTFGVAAFSAAAIVLMRG